MSFINVVYDVKIYMLMMSHNGMASVKPLSARGPGSAVGKATAYGLEGPVVESRWDRDFPHLSRPAMRPIQLPVQWVPGLSRGKGAARA